MHACWRQYLGRLSLPPCAPAYGVAPGAPDDVGRAAIYQSVDQDCASSIGRSLGALKYPVIIYFWNLACRKRQP